MDIFEEKIQHIAASNESISNFSNFCTKLHEVVGSKKEDCNIKLFTNILSVFLDMSNKTDDDRKQFFISHCRTFRAEFFIVTST